MEEILLILVGIAWAIGTPLMAMIALVQTARLKAQNERLADEVGRLKRQLAVTPLPMPLPAAEPSPAVEAAAPEPVATPELPPPFELPPMLPPVAPAVALPAAGPSGWDQKLGARVFVWLGAITLALAGIFLVRYSIEQGYLSPPVRVLLAAVFGFALIAGAERLRARDDRVAQALAGAGVASLYGALFAAVALYELISRPVAGGGALALTAFAIGVALRHGIFVAGLAFVGGFASPAIIGSQSPNTPVLFGYLLAIAAGTLAVIRHRGWWPLGWGVLAGTVLWTLAWMQSWAGGLAWVCAFEVAVAGLFTWATWRRLQENDNPRSEVALLVWLALGVTGGLLVGLVAQDEGEQVAGWLALAAHGIGLYALARWTPRFQVVAVLPPLLSLAALVLCRDLAGFAWTAGLLGGLWTAAAFALLWNAARPGFWAALSVGAALGHFLLCWYVLRDSAPGTPWGLIAIALAAPFLVGAERLVRWRDAMPGAAEAIGLLAAGVAFFVAVAIALELRREWITVAYAVEFAAVAHIARRLDLEAMRRLCWPLLAAVVVRFVLNPEVLRYPLGVTPVVNWMLWGYGAAIAALWVGRRALATGNDPRLLQATEAAIALLALTLATLEVRSLFHGAAMDTPRAEFLERAVYGLVWGGFAVAALWMNRARPSPVTLWAWRLAGSAALALVMVGQVLVGNPVFVKTDVGSWPLLNALLLAYAAPAALAVVARRWIDGEPARPAAVLTEAAALVLAFVWITLEVRHLFDPALSRRGIGSGELYAYSAVWLLFGVALLGLGLRRGTAALRHAGMALVCLVVVKVFVIDMAGLKGLLRVFSFLGLGAALIGLGYAYRRLASGKP
ncbi:MAG: DUF2339 domain-containing protein [Proteobacteria bacterium]|nr:DUF2339 domain-containing protein [Pseudomonadota bacterium]